MKKYIPLLIAFAILTAAYFGGNIVNQMDATVVEEYYTTACSEAGLNTVTSFEAIDDSSTIAYDSTGTVIAYISLADDVGYAGPLTVATIINTDGTIKDVVIVDSKETPSFLDKVERQGYYDQYATLTVTSPLVFGSDIEGVSGATLSTRAIANSVQEAAHSVASSQFGTTPEKAELEWEIGIDEIAVALIFIGGIMIGLQPKLKKLRFPFLILSVVVLGFWFNRSLSMATFSALFLGYFPTIQTNLIWYMMILGAILPIIITGKNFYCTYICPFCGLQEATHALSKVNLPLGKNIKWMKKVRDLILFAVIFIAFLAQNPSMSSFEPFGTIFGLNGSSFEWYLLFSVLVISFFYRRFWCQVFCPVGATLDKIVMFRRDIKKALTGKKTKKAGAKNVA